MVVIGVVAFAVVYVVVIGVVVVRIGVVGGVVCKRSRSGGISTDIVGVDVVDVMEGHVVVVGGVCGVIGYIILTRTNDLRRV